MVDACATCTNFNTCNDQRSLNCFLYNQTWNTSHRHLNKSDAQIRFPRKKKGEMEEENPAIAAKQLDERINIFFPNEILFQKNLAYHDN